MVGQKGHLLDIEDNLDDEENNDVDEVEDPYLQAKPDPAHPLSGNGLIV